MARIYKTEKNCRFDEKFYMWGFIPNGVKFCTFKPEACVANGQELDDAKYISLMKKLKEIKVEMDKLKNSDLKYSSDRTFTLEDMEKEYKELKEEAEYEQKHYNVK